MFLKLFFVIILFTNQSCIYLNKNETRPVKIKNNSNEEIIIGSDHFYLTDGSKRIFALNNTQIPYTFKEFYPEAVAANTYNTVITTAGILVVLTGLVVIGMTSGVHFPGSRNNSFYNENSTLSKNGLPQPQNYSTNNDDKPIWNSTSKTIKADYEHLLFDKRSLKPHEEAFALILFSKTQVKKMSPLNLFYLF